jgi:hypothetical protein
VKSLIRIRIQDKIKKLKNYGDLDAHNGGLEAQNEPRRAYRPEVIDSHHFDEEQDPDPDPY